MARPKKSETVLDEAVEQETPAVEPVVEKKKLVDEIVVSKPKGKSLSPELKKFIEEETKTVKGRFKNYETPGGRTRIMVKKYPGVEMFDKWMEDGQMYEIPLYVARHLNGVDITAKSIGGKVGTCSYPVHGFKSTDGNLNPSMLGDGGIPVPIVGVAKRVRRYGFESLEFDIS